MFVVDSRNNLKKITTAQDLDSIKSSHVKLIGDNSEVLARRISKEVVKLKLFGK